MPGAVPLNDLPDSLRGTAVPEDDLPGASAGEPRRGAVPSKVRAAQAGMEQQALSNSYRDTAAGEAQARTGMLDFGVNTLLNTPADLVNSGANLLASAAGRTANFLGIKNDWEAQARDPAHSISRIPLATQAGRDTATAIGEALPDWLQKVDPAYLDLANVAGAKGAGSALLPKRPGAFATKELAQGFKARGSGYTEAPVADVSQRYTVVPDDARHSAGVPPQQGITGSTRAALGPQVVDAEIPVANIRIATQRATQDLPGQLLDANGRVDAGLLRGALDAESVPYQQVAQLPVPPVNTLADRVRTAWLERGGSLKGDAVAESRLMPLMDAEAAALGTDDLLQRWREINGYASDLRKASGEGSAAAQIKSQDLRSIADAILDEIDSRAATFGTPDLVESLRGARVNIARLHTLDDSLDSVGWVDPTKLAGMADRHVPLTGGLAEVAADAKAAPRSLRPMERAIDSQDSQLDRFGREPTSWMRNVVGHMGGNLLARRGVESLNKELRAGSGLLKQDVPRVKAPLLYPANAGPPAPPQVEPPFSPWAGPLSLEPDPPEGFFGGRPEIRQGRNLAENSPLSLEGQPPGPSPLQQFEGNLLPWETPGQFDPVSPAARNGGFADQLGTPARGIDIPQPAAMPNKPRGVAGPRSAQLSDPRLPQGMQLLDNSAPPQSFFGPGDEFPGPDAPAAPVMPQGPLPAGGGGGFSEMLYRGVPEGADPMAPNERGFTTWSNQRPVAETYGTNVGEMQFDPATNIHLGTLEDARHMLGLPPEATAQDIAAAAVRRFAAGNRTASYDLPPELGGTPREFINFSNQLGQ